MLLIFCILVFCLQFQVNGKSLLSTQYGYNDSLVSATFYENEINIEQGDESPLVIQFSSSFQNDSALMFMTYQEGSGIKTTQVHEVVYPVNNFTVAPSLTPPIVAIIIKGKHPGAVVLGINSTSPQFKSQITTYCRVTVVISNFLLSFNSFVGWLYFIAWTISFYPQTILNFKRKSVIGLNLDFVTYNILGFLAYSFFNVGLYWFPSIQEEYHKQHPRGVIPVQLNDVAFSVHAVVIMAITVVQCIIYQRGNQRISKVCMILTVGMLLFVAISLILAGTSVITWLTYLYYFSYVKLFITIIKYVPQAVMNCRRKSTDGWSIGTILLDFTGGSLSMIQMFLIAYNNNDWSSIYGDPVKLGLGFFSVLFDIFFMIQHYCLFPAHSYQPLPVNFPDSTDNEERQGNTNHTAQERVRLFQE